LFKKHISKRRLQFYRYDLSRKSENPFDIACILDIPYPIYGMVFLTSYHFMNLGLLTAVLSFSFSSDKFGTVALFIAMAFATRYFGIRFDSKKPFRSLLLSGLRYLADGAYVLGGLLGGIKEGVIYLGATRSRKNSFERSAYRAGERDQ